MNETQYEKFQTYVVKPTFITITDVGFHPRTLAYGYTVDRNSWHCYVYDGEIHILVWWQDMVMFHKRSLLFLPEELRPNKRVYPDTVDERFAYTMADHGENLPFLGNFKWDTEDVARRTAKGNFKAAIHTEFVRV